VIVLFAAMAAYGAGIVYEGREGPGRGKHIVLVAGEWEYRAEQAFPMLAKILAKQHGFKCTVLFPINAKDGTIDPNVDDNIPGLEALKTADLMVTLMMMLELPDDQMRHIADYVASGKPVVGIRCSVLAFKFQQNKTSAYIRFRTDSTEWPGGFGQQVLGETWRGHHGHHAHESTRGLIDGPNHGHPILRGVAGDIWGPTDVYRIDRLPDDATVLVHGLVLTGMKPDDPPNFHKPIMPMIWTRQYTTESGKPSRVVTSTIGAAEDLQSEDLRRIFVNSVYWTLGLESEIPEKSNVDFVGSFDALPFGRDKFRKAVRPEDFQE
jgi:type 1 glutamine amidotransferase